MNCVQYSSDLGCYTASIGGFRRFGEMWRLHKQELAVHVLYLFYDTALIVQERPSLVQQCVTT